MTMKSWERVQFSKAVYSSTFVTQENVIRDVLTAFEEIRAEGSKTIHP